MNHWVCNRLCRYQLHGLLAHAVTDFVKAFAFDLLTAVAQYHFMALEHLLCR
ncbi:Uncharacterised protein [Vibrio cholerae]|nr:Uncharacterised protein [Vibrio cholerae]